MANGTIAFDTLQTSGQITGTAKSVDTDFVVNGSAKAWITADQSDNSTSDSFNVTSFADNATGQITLTLSNNMGNTGYAVTNCTPVSNASGLDGSGDSKTPTTGPIMQARDHSGSDFDPNCHHVVLNGDLA
mgnify:CR=1 FL=1|tara:strand:+ start:339 stop:731 length:393 start_codon:yes stop_codon:yes gene_type:complete